MELVNFFSSLLKTVVNKIYGLNHSKVYMNYTLNMALSTFTLLCTHQPYPSVELLSC